MFDDYFIEVSSTVGSVTLSRRTKRHPFTIQQSNACKFHTLVCVIRHRRRFECDACSHRNSFESSWWWCRERDEIASKSTRRRNWITVIILLLRHVALLIDRSLFIHLHSSVSSIRFFLFSAFNVIILAVLTVCAVHIKSRVCYDPIYNYLCKRYNKFNLIWKFWVICTNY